MLSRLANISQYKNNGNVSTHLFKYHWSYKWKIPLQQDFSLYENYLQLNYI